MNDFDFLVGVQDENKHFPHSLTMWMDVEDAEKLIRVLTIKTITARNGRIDTTFVGTLQGVNAHDKLE